MKKNLKSRLFSAKKLLAAALLVTLPASQTLAMAPEISAPENGEILHAPSGEVEISGFGDRGDQISVWSGANLVCSAEVESNTGFSFATSSSLQVDEKTLIDAPVVDQAVFDFSSESWRNDSTASWYSESSSETRCPNGFFDSGAAKCSRAFPANVLVGAENQTLSIFDGDSLELWKSISIENAQAVHATAGKILVATDSGVRVLDFENDELENRIFSGSVFDVAGAEILDTEYIIAAAENELRIRKGGSEISKSFSPKLVSITPDEKLLFSDGVSTFVSDEILADLSSDFAATDLSALISGSVQSIDENLVATTDGLFFVQTDGSIRRLDGEIISLPVENETILHLGNDTENLAASAAELENSGAETSAVAENADLQAFDFAGPGSSEFLTSDDSEFNITSDQISIGVWARRNEVDTTGDFQALVSHGDTYESRNYWLTAGDGFFPYPADGSPYFFGVRTENGEKAVSIPGTASADAWEFILGTYDGEYLRIYRNGVLENQVAHSGNLVNLNQTLRIGSGEKVERTFDGSISLPFISSSVYSDESAAELYETSSPWFEPESKVLLAGNSNSVKNVSCSDEFCLATTDSAVTKIDKTTSESTEILASDQIEMAADLGRGSWSCTGTFDADGEKTIFAQNDANESGNAISFDLTGLNTSPDFGFSVGQENYFNDQNIELEWTDSTGAEVAAYQIWRDGANVGETAELYFTDVSEKISGAVYQYQIQSVDSGGQVVNVSDILDVLYETTAPETSASVNIDEVGGEYVENPKITLAAADSGESLFAAGSDSYSGSGYFSGVSEIYFQKDSGSAAQIYTQPIEYDQNGDFTLRYYSVDRAGNQEAAKEFSLVVNVPVPETVATEPEEAVEETPKSSGSGKAKTIRWAGMKRGEVLKLGEVSLQDFEAEYAASLEQAQKMNKGVAGEVQKMKNRHGREVFLGYKKGRVAIDDFQRGNGGVRFTGVFRNERVARDTENLKTSAPETCAAMRFTTQNFRDISTRDDYYRDIAVANSLGFLRPSANHLIAPWENLDWETLLAAALQIRCGEVLTFRDLRLAKIPEISGAKLENTQTSRTIYSAVYFGVLDGNFDFAETPTRAQAAQILASALKISPEKMDGSEFQFEDIENAELAEILAAAGVRNWFGERPKSKFYPNESLTRADFSRWMSREFATEKEADSVRENYESKLKQLRKKEAQNQKNARVGIRATGGRSASETHLLGRRHQAEKDAAKAIFESAPNGWKPVNPETERAPMWRKDNSENIRRNEEIGRFRRNLEPSLQLISEGGREN